MESPIEFGYFEDTVHKMDGDSAEKQESKEKDSVHERLEKMVIALIKELLESQKNYIGEGMTAQVHSSNEDDGYCFKVISYRDAKGKNIPPPIVPITTEYKPIGGEQAYHLPEKEGAFLEALAGTSKHAIVPEPCCWAVYETEQDGPEYYSSEHLHVLTMKRLAAVSLRDVLEKDAPLPETYNHEEFFKNLRLFVAEMHAKGIYHRDLHEGNIMVDVKTGKPCVIDFGKSVFCSSNEREEDIYAFSYYKDGRKYDSRYIPDDDFMDRTEQLISSHTARQKLTATHNNVNLKKE